MRITKIGVVTALKNVGVFLASYTASGIAADTNQFLFALGIYAFISVPSDLYMLNRMENKK